MDIHDFIWQSLIAGWSEAFATTKVENVDQYCLDVRSLYPTVMGFSEKSILNFDTLYPIGLPKLTDTFNEDLIGFYEVLIHY